MEFAAGLLQRFLGGFRRSSSLSLGKIDSANAILQKHGITVVSGDLSLVKDRERNVYKIEKYCYSTPRNVKSAASEESAARSPVSSPLRVASEENNKFRFRVGAV